MKKIKNFAVVMFLLAFVSFFAVSKNASADTTYLVKVNRQVNCVTVYKLDENGEYQPVKAMICSSGYATESGTYSMGEKIRWHTLDGPCYGQYCARIYGGVLFHSVWYYNNCDPGSLSVNAYNQLGTTCSHGCIRLTVADAKWLYDNVPTGSTVQIYTSSNPGPLGKPAAIKIPNGVAWDPTDIWSEGNPWNSKKPEISGVKSASVSYGSDFDVMSGVSAVNTTGCDATENVKTVIKYEGEKVKKINTNNPGTYKVIYKLTDEIGRRAKCKKAKFKVTAPQSTPEINNVHDLYVNSTDKLKKKLIYKNISFFQNGVALDKKYVKVKFVKKKENVYRAKITAQNASIPAKAKIKVFIDTTAPVITGVVNGQTYTSATMSAISADYIRSIITVMDDMSGASKDDAKIKITPQVDGSTKVKIVVKDVAKNKTKYFIYFRQAVAGAPTTAPVATVAPVVPTTTTAVTTVR